MITQINSLQRRLIAKTEEVKQKEDLIQEKEKLYIKLKAIVARQSGTDMAEPLEKYKQKIKDETNRLKKLKDDIGNYRLTIRNYELEIKRVDQNVEKLQQKWFNLMKNNNFEQINNFNQILEENPTNEAEEEEDEYEENNNQDENNINSENANERERNNENKEFGTGTPAIDEENREFFEFEKAKLNSV